MNKVFTSLWDDLYLWKRLLLGTTKGDEDGDDDDKIFFRVAFFPFISID